jgi:hypothetical protein
MRINRYRNPRSEIYEIGCFCDARLACSEASGADLKRVLKRFGLAYLLRGVLVATWAGLQDGRAMRNEGFSSQAITEMQVEGLLGSLIFWPAIVRAQLAWRLGVKERITPFRFEQFDPILGIGNSDETGARAEVLKVFPPGTALDKFKQFFGSVGGDCFTLDHEAPARLYCIYAHAKYPQLPFWPVSTTWMVVATYAPGTDLAQAVDLSVAATSF